ncbi:MAG: hypothetical protein GX187_05600 [Clostridiaceae bacterium]|nr:hypothetical protein [Clostridiaceae bacterium]
MFKQKTFKRKFTLALFFIICSLFIISPASKSFAATIEIFTKYPSIAVKAGEQINTDVTIENKTGSGMTVKLDIVSLPENWEAYIEGGGRIIDRVYVSGEDKGDIDLKVKIPYETAEGKYQVVLNASSGSYSRSLTLYYDVKAEIENQDTLKANYNELAGTSDATFTFELEIKNNKQREENYSLNANAERGWQVKFKSKTDYKQISSITIDSNSASKVEVEIIPPASVNAGEYTIPITVSSGSETLSTDLKVNITGTYDMKLTTPNGRLNAETNAGKEQEIELTIENTGSSALNNIELTSWQPDEWKVRFEPEQVDTILPGETASVKAFITPSSKALAGDYVVEITAKTPEVTSSAQFRVMVKTSTLWGIVGVLIIILLVSGLYYIFRIYGRR